MSLRFKISLSIACLTFVMVLVSFLVLLNLIRQKRIDDLKNYSTNLAHQLVVSPSVSAFLEERPDAPLYSEVKQNLNCLLKGSPFIEELTLIDRFGKIPFRVFKETGSQSDQEVPRASFSLHSVIASGVPSLNQESWEYFVPLSLSENSYWGVLRLRWSPEATWGFFRSLKTWSFYSSVLSFVFVFVFTYIVFLRVYTKEHARMAKAIAMITGSDYSQRIDIFSFSNSMSEIGTYLNRLLTEVQAEKQKVTNLNESLREIERGYAHFRKSSASKVEELENYRKELREGILKLLDMMWCGVIVIDDKYQIHYMNDKAERLLRYARYDEEKLYDEKLRHCLAPLVQFETVDRIEDLCVWTQKELERSVSCRVRATSIPTSDQERFFFVVMNEESGFPKRRDSMYFSERLVIDILAHGKNQDSTAKNSPYPNVIGSTIENRFRECLKRIEAFRNLECNQFGPIKPVRLGNWLQKRFEADDLFSENLNIVTMMPEVDMTLFVPEICLSQLIDCTISLITFAVEKEGNQKNKTLAVRASVDSRGKPVISFSIPHMVRKDVLNLQNSLGERAHLICEKGDEKELSLDELEHDISISLYQCVKKLLKIKAESIYSENKKLITLRYTIEQHIFSAPKPETSVKPEAIRETRDLVREYLTRA